MSVTFIVIFAQKSTLLSAHTILIKYPRFLSKTLCVGGTSTKRMSNKLIWFVYSLFVCMQWQSYRCCNVLLFWLDLHRDDHWSFESWSRKDKIYKHNTHIISFAITNSSDSSDSSSSRSSSWFTYTFCGFRIHNAIAWIWQRSSMSLTFVQLIDFISYSLPFHSLFHVTLPSPHHHRHCCH